MNMKKTISILFFILLLASKLYSLDKLFTGSFIVELKSINDKVVFFNSGVANWVFEFYENNTCIERVDKNQNGIFEKNEIKKMICELKIVNGDYILIINDTPYLAQIKKLGIINPQRSIMLYSKDAFGNITKLELKEYRI